MHESGGEERLCGLGNGVRDKFVDPEWNELSSFCVRNQQKYMLASMVRLGSTFLTHHNMSMIAISHNLVVAFATKPCNGNLTTVRRCV